MEPLFRGLSGPEIYLEYITRLSLRASELDIANDVLIIDDATPSFVRSLRIKLFAECYKIKRVRPFKKIVGGNSRREDGIQISDMIAGAISHFIIGAETEYYQTFANKIVDFWEWPAK